MKVFKNLYDQKYSQISIYATKTAGMIFVLGLIIYYISGKVGGAVSFAGAVLNPLVLGLVMTYLLSPVVAFLEHRVFGFLKKRNSRRAAAVLVTFAVLVALIVLVLGIIVVTVTKRISAFNVADLKDYIAILNEQFSRFWSTIERQLASMNINLGSLGIKLRVIFNNIKSGASTLLFASIFAIYFLLDYKIRGYWKDMLGTFTSDKTREGLKQFALDADRVFSGYIRGQALDAAMVGLLVSVALTIAGIPYAVVIGILTGCGNLVPYIGPVVGFGSLIIIALADGSLSILLIGGVILAVVMFVDGNIINPRMLSSNVHVHPVLVIVALLAGSKVGGVVGMLVAVPIAALLKLQLEKYVEKKKREKEKKALADG